MKCKYCISNLFLDYQTLLSHMSLLCNFTVRCNYGLTEAADVSGWESESAVEIDVARIDWLHTVVL